MRLTIFGASSLTGKQLVKKSLVKGFDVTAFVRTEAKLGITRPNLKVLCGDALNFKDVDLAVRGTDAVLSMLGPKGKPAVMAAESTRNIVTAMEKHHVNRLVLVSVAGVAVPQDKRSNHFIDSMLKYFLKDVFLDRENQLGVLNASQVDWIAVRVPRLTDEAGTGRVKAFFGNPSPMMKLSREDLADFMLEQITSDRWLKQAPILSNY
jgi:putative NADH-flavin reductase